MNLKVGQLVYCSSFMSDSKGTSGYGTVLSIIDRNTNEHYLEKDIITGHGEKNTKVNIEVNIITKPLKRDESFWDITTKIELLDKPIKCIFDPHDISKININYFEKEYNEVLDNMNKKIEFIKKYSLTRDDKLNIILDI